MKAVSLSYTIIHACSTDIPLLFVAFLSTTHLLYQILLFSSPFSPLFSSCVPTTLTLCSVQPPNSLVTPVLYSMSSFLSWSIRVTPQMLLKHLISITFNLFFSSTAIFHVSAHCNAVHTATPSYNLLFI